MSAVALAMDDFRVENNGKLMLIGLYPGNIFIFSEEQFAPQLYILFNVDLPLTEVPKKILFEAALPGIAPVSGTIEVVPFDAGPEHTRWIMRHVLHFPTPILRPGKIVVRVVADDVDIPLSAPWIVTMPPVQPQAVANAAPSA